MPSRVVEDGPVGAFQNRGPAWVAPSGSMREEFVSLEVREHGTPIMMARGFRCRRSGQCGLHGGPQPGPHGSGLSLPPQREILSAADAHRRMCRHHPVERSTLMMIDMVAAALVTGNTVVLKPASINSLLGVKFTEMMEKLGLPPGVFNLVTGPGGLGRCRPRRSSRGGPDPFYRKQRDGKGDHEGRVPRRQRNVIMELGGNNPVIVCEDADVEPPPRSRRSATSATPHRTAPPREDTMSTRRSMIGSSTPSRSRSRRSW